MKATIYECEWEIEGLLARVGQKQIDDIVKLTLKDLQGIVGGLIEIYHEDGFDYVMNEEGLLLGLPINPEFRKRGRAWNLAGTVIKVHGRLK